MLDFLYKLSLVFIIILFIAQAVYSAVVTSINQTQFHIHSTSNHRNFSTLYTKKTFIRLSTNSLHIPGLGGPLGESGTNIVGQNINLGGAITAYGNVNAANVNANLTTGTLAGKYLSDGITSSTIESILGLPATIPEVCGTDINTAIYDGAPGKPIFCNLSGGTRSVLYDANGLNPTSMSPFVVHLYYGSDAVTPLYWSWYTGGDSNSIYGTGISNTFTPSVKTIFNQYSSNNYVEVMVTYSTASTGRLYCKTGTPISVNKMGAIGPEGPPGTSAAITEKAVFDVLSTPSNNTMYLKESTLNTFKIKFVDANGYERFGITGSGKLVHMDTGGQTRFSYNPDDHSFTLFGSTGQAIMKVYSGYRTTFYRRSGQAIMSLHSSGRVVLGGS